MQNKGIFFLSILPSKINRNPHSLKFFPFHSISKIVFEG